MARIWPRYQRAGRKHKQLILNEFCINCEYERKYAIKLLNKPLGGRQRPPGPEATYGETEREVLAYLWRQTDYLCSKRLKAALPIWLPHYERHHGALSPDVRERLGRISAATIDRLLAPVRAKAAPHGRCGTRPGTLLRTQIPIRAEEWNVNEPGYLEADTVAHCGGSLAGNFVWSVTYTDIWTGWTESRAVWNKGFEGVLTQTRELEAVLPFPILAFDCDNGGEFLNYHIAAPAKKNELYQQLKADAVEMEGAALAQVSYQQEVPFIVIRGMSDNADEKANIDLKRFYKTAANNSAQLVTALVEILNASVAQ